MTTHVRDFALINAAKLEFVGDAVQHAREPRKTIRKRAVEIEDDEGVGQG